MGQTIAEMYIEQGRVEGEQKGAVEMARNILLLQLRERFKKVPRKVESRIAATTNLHDLETWLVKMVNAATLTDVGILRD